MNLHYNFSKNLKFLRISNIEKYFIGFIIFLLIFSIFVGIPTDTVDIGISSPELNIGDREFYINENLYTIWSNSSNYIINDNHNENYKKSINEKELKDLAIASGGLYYDYNNFTKINKNLEFKEEINKTKRTITTIDYQVLWMLKLFFLITEWFIRKKNGLL